MSESKWTIGQDLFTQLVSYHGELKHWTQQAVGQIVDAESVTLSHELVPGIKAVRLIKENARPSATRFQLHATFYVTKMSTTNAYGPGEQ
jgi:hypothetical protein